MSVQKQIGLISDSALTDVVAKEMRAIGMREGERLISKVIDFKGINDQGDLKGSINTKVDQDGNTIRMEVGPDAEHAPYVQSGTRPHWAPIGPLKAWARRKVGDAGFGYYVQKKIAREGTDPQDFLTGPARKLARDTPGMLEDAIADNLFS
jgi:hypothetical protein